MSFRIGRGCGRFWNMNEGDEEEWSGVESREGERRSSWRQTMVMTLVGLFVVAALIGLSQPRILRSAKASERTQAINNAKQVGLALLEFDQEYGSFPEEATIEMVRRATKTKLNLSGNSSNAIFRQLIAFGIQSEYIFYCVHPDADKPDGDMRPGRALEAGEVGFAYIAGLNTSLNPGKVVLLAPMKHGTRQFWREPFQTKAVLLRLDNSVEAPLIREEDGLVSVGKGKTLFDTGDDTVWGAGYEIDLRYPEKP